MPAEQSSERTEPDFGALGSASTVPSCRLLSPISSVTEASKFSHRVGGQARGIDVHVVLDWLSVSVNDNCLARESGCLEGEMN